MLSNVVTVIKRRHGFGWEEISRYKTEARIWMGGNLPFKNGEQFLNGGEKVG